MASPIKGGISLSNSGEYFSDLGALAESCQTYLCRQVFSALTILLNRECATPDSSI